MRCALGRAQVGQLGAYPVDAHHGRTGGLLGAHVGQQALQQPARLVLGHADTPARSACLRAVHAVRTSSVA